MRLYFILILYIFISLNAVAEEQELKVVIQGHGLEEIYLTDRISEKVLTFDASEKDDAFGLLPVYIERIKLASDAYDVSAVISKSYGSILSSEQLALITDLDKISHDYILYDQLVYSKGEVYAEIILLPYKNANGNSVEALDSCIIRVDIIPSNESSRASTTSFAENSVLSSGEWYRLSATETGIYKITHDDMTEMGINPSAVDPSGIRIFGNGNGIVPEKNSDERIDDLKETPCFISGEEDGSFDEGDYILFYGQSPIKWTFTPFEGYGIFQHQSNPYEDHTYYYLNISDEAGKRVAVENNSALIPTVFVDEFTGHAVHEYDAVNILKTGRQWYGELYSEVSVYEYEFEFPNIVRDYKLSLSSNVAAHSIEQSQFDFYYDNLHVMDAPVSKIIEGTTVYAWTTTPDTAGFYPSSDEIVIRVEYDRPTSTSLGWMNFISMNARQELKMSGSFMSFRDHLSYGPEEVAEYTLSGADEQIQVWDVSDPFNITLQSGNLSGDKFIYRSPADIIREFIAFDGSGFLTAEFIEAVPNQNLHAYEAVDYIILSHPDFMDQAQRMLRLHQTVSGLSGFIVTPQPIYNEFSSGKQDPGAIRDFVRMLYERADEGSRPKYLLLLGDASYDYKNRIPNNTNFIPTYQSAEALKLGYSFVTDDYYALLDPGEGVNAYGKSLEIGIGRFPVHTVEQADQMVDKVEAYMTLRPSVFGDWRNAVYFIADDEDQNLHFTQAEKLQHMLDTGQHVYNLNKIYLDAFPQESTPSGSRYPDVNVAIDNMMETGSLIVNYTGHGGEAGWTKEKVLDIPSINKWSNWDRLPLFITATCEFSRFDDPSIISAGECVFLNPQGGGIGLLTTSRLAWADPNFRLNKAVYKYMFDLTDGNYYKIGDVVRLSKTDQNNGTNIKNFVLLGDPAMQLSFPDYNIETISIDGTHVSLPGWDTLMPMSEVTVNGMISDFTGDTVRGFNGYLYPTIFDKDVKMYTLGNDASSYPAYFYVLGQNLYSGRATVANGLFSFSFYMPQNMSAKIDLGKISYYAYDSVNLLDAHGYYRVRTGGVNPNANPDEYGPDLSLFLNNTNFESGDLTDNEPVFLAYLTDEQGINHTGNGIGRDIILTIDNDPQLSYILNDMFEPDLDSYNGGWISFPLSDLADGTHVLSLKAWDNVNNVSEKTLSFEVNMESGIALTSVMNYPNPFQDETNFIFNHNKPGNSFNVEVRIFNINGQHVRSLSQYCPAEGLSISPIKWDGTDDGGNKLGNGIYVYRIYVLDQVGEQFVQTSKLIYLGSK